MYIAPDDADTHADTLRYDGRPVRDDEYPPPPTWTLLCSCWRRAATRRPTMRELREAFAAQESEPWQPESRAAEAAASSSSSSSVTYTPVSSKEPSVTYTPVSSTQK